ncbi:MAG: helix-turn-helix transcriptional regulator [Schwartzia succinivorans]|uniref:helix-turn-helix transcriptional regulator n=1 Tax=Schwartzia succinivorans TaxID=55507 RepID=UPI00235492C7|nr:helix-turn-helix transcriptional regulator [Schwartzia succinivorans]MBE6096377.1 helix-turn-helix transcriptional regulator [Schwartzia succinivorans]
MNKLKYLRIMRELSQKDVADAINKSQQAYGSYEKGNRGMDIETLKLLADFYNVSIDFLVDHQVHEKNNDAQISSDELTLIMRYRMISDTAKGIVDTIIDSEFEKVIKEKEDKTETDLKQA